MHCLLNFSGNFLFFPTIQEQSNPQLCYPLIRKHNNNNNNTNSSYATSFRYILQDVLGIALCIYLGHYIEYIPFITLRIACWITLFITQGALMTGLWVIAHECGHQSFSPNLIVNDTVGCILHSMLLVPYWSWKYSHGQHHSNTDSMHSDTVFVPYTHKEVSHHFSPTRGTAISRLIGVIRMSLIGWFVYLFFDVSGPRKHRKHVGWTSHFNPFCPYTIKLSYV